MSSRANGLHQREQQKYELVVCVSYCSREVSGPRAVRRKSWGVRERIQGSRW